jgi:hypothetical protein
MSKPRAHRRKRATRGSTTKVGKYRVQVRSPNLPALWYFSAGARGKKELGVYAFWTAVLGGRRKLTGRAIASLPPGHRFGLVREEMRSATNKETRSAYRRIWLAMGAGQSIAYIRPSTENEVARWMSGHESDARFARKIRIR